MKKTIIFAILILVLSFVHVCAEEKHTINVYYYRLPEIISSYASPEKFKSQKCYEHSFEVIEGLVCWLNIDGNPIIEYSEEWYEPERVLMLSDDKKITDFLKSKGLKSIEDYVILSEPFYYEGYMLYVNADNKKWCIPIFNRGERCGMYENGKLYSIEDYIALTTQKCSMYVNYKKSSVNAQITNGMLFIPLKAVLEGMYSDVIYDENKRTYAIGEYSLKMNEDGTVSVSMDKFVSKVTYIQIDGVDYMQCGMCSSMLRELNRKTSYHFHNNEYKVDFYSYEAADDFTAQNPYRLYVSGREKNTSTNVIKNFHYIFIPIRDFAECINEEITWDSDNRTITMGEVVLEVPIIEENKQNRKYDYIIIRKKNSESMINYYGKLIDNRVLMDINDLNFIAGKYSMCLIPDDKARIVYVMPLKEFVKRTQDTT